MGCCDSSNKFVELKDPIANSRTGLQTYSILRPQNVPKNALEFYSMDDLRLRPGESLWFSARADIPDEIHLNKRMFVPRIVPRALGMIKFHHELYYFNSITLRITNTSSARAITIPAGELLGWVYFEKCLVPLIF